MPVTTRTAPVSWLPPYCRVPSDAPRPAHRIFLLSPADCGGTRADLLMRERAAFPLAVRLRSAGGVTLGEAFSFLSGLYFRGKLAYARRFARPPDPVDPVHNGRRVVVVGGDLSHRVGFSGGVFRDATSARLRQRK